MARQRRGVKSLDTEEAGPTPGSGASAGDQIAVPLDSAVRRRMLGQRYNVDGVSAQSFAMRRFIESRTGVLQKVMDLANGVRPDRSRASWEEQKEAIYKLLPKVAPDLKSLDVVMDPSEQDREQSNELAHSLFGRLIEGFAEVAHARATEEPEPTSGSDDGGTVKMVEDGTSEATPTEG